MWRRNFKVANFYWQHEDSGGHSILDTQPQIICWHLKLDLTIYTHLYIHQVCCWTLLHSPSLNLQAVKRKRSLVDGWRWRGPIELSKEPLRSFTIQFLIACSAFYYLYGLIENPLLLFPVQCIVAVWGLSPPCHHVTLILTVIVPLMVTLPAPGACLLQGADSDISVKINRSYYACGFVLLRHAACMMDISVWFPH